MAQAAPTQTQLLAQAKVKEIEAKKIALEQVPTGSIKAPKLRMRRVTSSGPSTFPNPARGTLRKCL